MLRICDVMDSHTCTPVRGLFIIGYLDIRFALC